MKPRPYRETDGEIWIMLTMGKEAVVDKADEALASHNWRAHKTQGLFYAARRIPGGKTVLLHRVVAERAGHGIDGLDVDHRDRDGLNCRRSNLRPATSSQNKWNMPAHRRNRCGHKGVSWHRATKKWSVRLVEHGRLHRLGHFEDLELAAFVYQEAAHKFHGDFARVTK